MNGSYKGHYVNCVDIIKENDIYPYSDTLKTHTNGNTILNSLSLPIRHILESTIGRTLSQVKPLEAVPRDAMQGEGRANPRPHESQLYPSQCTKLQKSFLSSSPIILSFHAPKVGLLRGAVKRRVSEMRLLGV